MRILGIFMQKGKQKRLPFCILEENDNYLCGKWKILASTVIEKNYNFAVGNQK